MSAASPPPPSCDKRGCQPASLCHFPPEKEEEASCDDSAGDPGAFFILRSLDKFRVAMPEMVRPLADGGANWKQSFVSLAPFLKDMTDRPFQFKVYEGHRQLTPKDN